MEEEWQGSAHHRLPPVQRALLRARRRQPGHRGHHGRHRGGHSCSRGAWAGGHRGRLLCAGAAA
eukprot:7368216-Pyramimonas_sp.AAC.1